jgi:hypothetical protein
MRAEPLGSALTCSRSLETLSSSRESVSGSLYDTRARAICVEIAKILEGRSGRLGTGAREIRITDRTSKET